MPFSLWFCWGECDAGAGSNADLGIKTGGSVRISSMPNNGRLRSGNRTQCYCQLQDLQITILLIWPFHTFFSHVFGQKQGVFNILNSDNV